MHGIPFHSAPLGRDRCEAGDIARHRHREGYMTLVLAGGYAEAGDSGRFRVEAGDVLVHLAFEAHRDAFAGRSADVLNLPLVEGLPDGAALRVDDADAVAKLAERDRAAAARLVARLARPRGGEEDWPDLLAAALLRPDPIRLGGWARRHGLSPEAVSRGFQQAFGTTPIRYRAEARARLALRRIAEGSLAGLAAELGFADQAHMTRAVVSLSGAAPAQWRCRLQMDSRPPAATDAIGSA